MYEHFGRNHVGLIATFPAYLIRGATRDVGKAMSLPAAEVDRLAKLGDDGSARNVRTLMASSPEFREKLEQPDWTRFADMVEAVAGFPRQISQHVGGMVISTQPLIDLVPLEQSAMPDRILMQWDK